MASARLACDACRAAGHGGLTYWEFPDYDHFAVTYRVAGLLTEVGSLISARSRLRECMLDALHGAGIDIVSPTFMNTRALERDASVIPQPQAAIVTHEGVAAEEVAFEKATIEQMRDTLQVVAAQAHQRAEKA